MISCIGSFIMGAVLAIAVIIIFAAALGSFGMVGED